MPKIIYASDLKQTEPVPELEPVPEPELVIEEPEPEPELVIEPRLYEEEILELNEMNEIIMDMKLENENVETQSKCYSSNTKAIPKHLFQFHNSKKSPATSNASVINRKRHIASRIDIRDPTNYRLLRKMV